ncbi:hypothetical protein [Ancylobacter sp.]|uniref:hypothetical protein n=1 Tax=Ancylobacter sp. TaxID=1872567 RepID=UPI003C79D247
MKTALIVASVLFACAQAHAQGTRPEWQSTLSADGSKTVAVYSLWDYGPKLTFGMFCNADQSVANRRSYFFLSPGLNSYCATDQNKLYGVDLATVKFGDRFVEFIMKCRAQTDSNSTWYWTDPNDTDTYDGVIEFENRFKTFEGDEFSVEVFNSKIKSSFSHTGRQVFNKLQSECVQQQN